MKGDDDEMAVVNELEKQKLNQTPWGGLRWSVNGEIAPGCESTCGMAEILPGASNDLHMHPNSEEVIYVLQGYGVHRIGDEVHPIAPGTVVHVPRGVRHNATNNGNVVMKMVIFYNTPERQTVKL